MTYIDASWTTAADPAATLAAALHGALIAEGYTLEDTVVIGTCTHKVYKSAAAINTEGIDWYLDVAYTTTGAGSVWLGAFETYDTVAHTAGLGPYRGTSSAVDPVEFSRFGATKYALETNWSHISANLARIQTQASAMAYWVSITPTRVIALSSVSSSSVVYCGQFNPYQPWKAKVASETPGKWNPLTTLTLVTPHSQSHGSMGTCVVNRVPPVASLGSNRWDYTTVLKSASGAADNSNGGNSNGGPSGYIDNGWSPYLAGGPLGDRIQIVIERAPYQSLPGNWGHCAGHLYDVARFGTSGSTSVLRGDTATVDGDPWVLASATSGACFGFKGI